jgi:hypothetical protein
MTSPHRNAPLTIEGRRRLVERCRARPIAHVAAEMGISRACAAKWVNRWRRHGDLGLLDRPSPPGHMVHLDVKKVGRIPHGGGRRIHGRDSKQAKAAGRAKSAGAKRGYVYLRSAIHGFSRLAYTEPLADEKGATAAAFLAR